MAKYYLRLATISRANGSRVTRAAAYRSGERIRDERTRESYNHSGRTDVAAKDIVLPKEMAGRTDMDWARNRPRLWNEAEAAGRRRDSRLAREVQVLLPPELNPEQRATLVHRFSQELADKYRSAVDYAVHRPRPGADPRHHHAHLLMTTREVTPQGLGARTALELSGTERHARGLGYYNGDVMMIRERWAQVTNEAFREAGLSERIDHRSYKAQGLDIEPKPTIPPRIYYQEKYSGRSHPAGDDIRAQYAERVAARQLGPRELERVVQRQKAQAHRVLLERERQQREQQSREQRHREQRHREQGSRERQREPPPPTAEQSVKNWLALKKDHVTEEDSVKRWLEYRAAHAKAGAERGIGDGDAAKTVARERGQDYER